MNNIVEELSALVGGSSQKVTTSSLRTVKKLKASERTFHQIAEGTTGQDGAEKSIPLGNSGGFEGFNSWT